MSAAGIVSAAFYPFSSFDAGTHASQRSLTLGHRHGSAEDDALDLAADHGWAYLELPEKLTVRTDTESASRLARLVQRLLDRGADVTDEIKPEVAAWRRRTSRSSRRTTTRCTQ